MFPIFVEINNNNKIILEMDDSGVINTGYCGYVPLVLVIHVTFFLVSLY